MTFHPYTWPACLIGAWQMTTETLQECFSPSLLAILRPSSQAGFSVVTLTAPIVKDVPEAVAATLFAYRRGAVKLWGPP